MTLNFNLISTSKIHPALLILVCSTVMRNTRTQTNNNRIIITIITKLQFMTVYELQVSQSNLELIIHGTVINAKNINKHTRK